MRRAERRVPERHLADAARQPLRREASGSARRVIRQLAVVAFTALLAACAEGSEAPGPPEPPATPLAFTAHGLPGPWWRLGASPREFQRDSRTCREQSSRARERATRDARETAYRAFLDCMEARMWQRGTPPKQPRAGA